MKKLIVIILSLFIAHGLQSQNGESKRLLKDWWFYKTDIGSPWEAFRSERLSKLPVFKKVQLPHTYNAFDAVDPDGPYYQGPAWYYTFIKIDTLYPKGRILLHFEGAGQESDVYVFLKKAGHHKGGYDEWSVDITEYAERYFVEYPEGVGRVPKGLLPVAVRTDNSRDVNRIPSDLSDFTIYGGLYRNVWLEYVPQVYFNSIHVDYTLSKNFKKAFVTLSGNLKNFSGEKGKNAVVTITVKDENGKRIKQVKEQIPVKEGKTEIGSFKIKNVKLWSPDNPFLYTFNVELNFHGTIQKKSFKTGFKHFEFEDHGPFFLNGKRLLLRGTSYHEDYAGRGAAGTKELMRKEFLMMKEMGVNFIRLGHYQQPQYVLDLCDSLGILVWEEIPWCRGGLGNDEYRQQARRMLTNLINQHYNHASVIIWGLGNENDWPGDFPQFEKDSIIAFMKSLNNLAHSLDPVRKTAIRRCDFCKNIVDVYSPSIWAGWYRGKYTSYKEVSKMEADKVKHFLHAEWGASMHPERHSENPDKGLGKIANVNEADERSGDFLLTGGEPRVSKDGDWSETYGCNLIDWTLKEQETMDWLTGSAFWIFKDFSTPLRPDNPIPYVNEKGAVQRDFTPKDAYYVFQSYWTDKPMAHIYSHTWKTRWGAENENKLIKVYSNCDVAELFLNGKSLGKRKRNSRDFPAAGLRWKTTFKPGLNKVKVVAQKGDVTVIDSVTFIYQTEKWGKPVQLKFEPAERINDSTFSVCVKAYDKDNIFCPDAKNVVIFGIAGKGKLLDDLGTINGSRKIQMSNGKACIKIVTNEKAVVSAVSKNTSSIFIKINNNLKP